jgi:sterol desaturase/sphingolipid hydroxylase (fatty acid hydroxylase superfamily)
MGMPPNLISYAVPVFFAAIAIEAFIGRRRRLGIYRLGSAITDLDVGIASQVVDVFLKVIGLAAYQAVYEHRLITFPEGSPLPWIIGLIGIDFVYYWWHRASHVVNLLWAVHSVHHQSEDLNLAVALRQPAFEALTIIPFHVPLALLGVSPAVYVSSYAIDLIYQFWIHTELTKKLGWLEKVLNTPSAHRVHHGINAKYLDKNYGGILVIWDRIFGTYQPEEELPVYGVTHPLTSYNPIWANLAPFGDIAALSLSASRPADKLRAWFAHPGWRPTGTTSVAHELPTRASFRKYDPHVTGRAAGYVFAHFLLLSAAGGAFMTFSERVALGQLVPPALVVLCSTLTLGALIEGKRWALPLDLARQAAGIGLVASYAVEGLGAGTGILVSGAFLLAMAGLFVAFRPDRAEITSDYAR